MAPLSPHLPMPMALRPCQVYFTYKAPISVRVLLGDKQPWYGAESPEGHSLEPGVRHPKTEQEDHSGPVSLP